MRPFLSRHDPAVLVDRLNSSGLNGLQEQSGSAELLFVLRPSPKIIFGGERRRSMRQLSPHVRSLRFIGLALDNPSDRAAYRPIRLVKGLLCPLTSSKGQDMSVVVPRHGPFHHARLVIGNAHASVSARHPPPPGLFHHARSRIGVTLSRSAGARSQ